jgi:hypothetical protein
MDDGIPEFLRLTPAQRRAAWKDRKLTVVSRTRPKREWRLPASIDATGRAILRQLEKEKTLRAKARLAALALRSAR